MNKTAIKNFAIWARRKLIDDITYKAGLLGVSEKGIAAPLPQSKPDMQFFDIGTKRYAEVYGKEITQRDALVSAIKSREKSFDYKTAFKNVIEETAYTWFNRLIAVRFMEINDYLPSRVRVLSSETPKKNEPDFVTTPFDTDMEFTPDEYDRVMQLKDESKLDELFRMLFIKQCNKLNEILPELFEKTDDYTELLLTISFTDTDGVIYHLTHDISEDDFNVSKEGQIEIIGWMYQYYNTEPKDEVFALLKKNVKITKERIPAATQLFTPDWIVRYMVENSLGRLWVEWSLESGELREGLREGLSVESGELREKGRIAAEKAIAEKMGWKYYLPEAEQTPEVRSQLSSQLSTLNTKNIKLIDPCMGSGHILVYAFDVLMQIYLSCGYTERDAVKSILENNLYGLDIDGRAYQLAYFALMMKARQYDRRILTREIKPCLRAIHESNSANRDLFKLYSEEIRGEAEKLLDVFADAKVYGSILNIPQIDLDALETDTKRILESEYKSIFDSIRQYHVKYDFAPLVELARMMSQKYDVVVTNPPYMGASGMSDKLSEYVKKYYPDSKSDLFACFIEKCGQMVKENCYQAMITQHAWMFLSSFEKLRKKLLTVDTVNMAHLGARAFEEIGGEVVQTTSFVLRNSHIKNCKGVYCRLVEPTTQIGKEDMFLAGENRFESAQDNFTKIPGSPIAYWVSERFIKAFNNKRLGDVAYPKTGFTTGNNDDYLRFWFEVSEYKINQKWFYLNKGGPYRKWYGNNEYVVDWESDGLHIRNNKGSTIRNPDFYFKRGVTWSKITSYKLSGRLSPEMHIFDAVGLTCFTDDKMDLYFVLALFCSEVSSYFLSVLNPTLSMTTGAVANLPVKYSEKTAKRIHPVVEENICISKSDWDAFETSWDFKRHPLLPSREATADIKREE